MDIKRILEVYVKSNKLVVKAEDSQGYYKTFKMDLDAAIELKEYINELL